jgi:hypothetical protein
MCAGCSDGHAGRMDGTDVCTDGWDGCVYGCMGRMCVQMDGTDVCTDGWDGCVYGWTSIEWVQCACVWCAELTAVTPYGATGGLTG